MARNLLKQNIYLSKTKRFNWSEKRMKGRHDEHSKLVIDAVNIPHWYIWTVLTMGYFSWKCWSWLQLDEIKIMTASLSYWIFPSGQKRTWFQILKCIDFQKAKIGERNARTAAVKKTYGWIYAKLQDLVYLILSQFIWNIAHLKPATLHNKSHEQTTVH